MTDPHDHGPGHPQSDPPETEAPECVYTEGGEECALESKAQGPHGHLGQPGHEGHEHHAHNLKGLSQRRLLIALVINAAFLVVEVIGGLASNSLALLADAGHMLTDVAALALALFVARLAARPATPERTFGLLRAEVLGAFANGATLVLIVGLVLREAWARIGEPQEVQGPLMLGIAFAGLIANLASARILAGSRKESLNVEGAFLHMVADALGSVGAMVAAIVIALFGWYLIDPIASVIIGVLILWSSWKLLKTTLNILLEATPENINYDEVKNALIDHEHIERVHDLHIWTITSGAPMLTAHISLAPCCCGTDAWQKCIQDAQDMLRTRFGIAHSTLQIEPTGCDRECNLTQKG